MQKILSNNIKTYRVMDNIEKDNIYDIGPIQAIQYHGDSNSKDVLSFAGVREGTLYVPCEVGIMPMQKDEYLLKTPEGGLYLFKKEVFENTYEEV